MHIYDPRFPQLASRSPVSSAAVADYRLLQKRIGTTRVVVVQPRNHATDNQVTLDAVARLGPDARGIAVLHPTVTDAELKRLDAGASAESVFRSATRPPPSSRSTWWSRSPNASPLSAGTCSCTCPAA
jgi:predicted TIM-barrel fold metal-dependent hydrolase